MSMIVCTQCGFENPDRNKFCQNCGLNLAETDAETDTSVNDAGINTSLQVVKPQAESTSWRDSGSEDRPDLDNIDRLNVAIAPSTAPSTATSSQDRSADTPAPTDIPSDINIAAEVDLSDARATMGLDIESDLDRVNAAGETSERPDLIATSSSDLDRQPTAPTNPLQMPVTETNKSEPLDKASKREPRLVSMKHAGLTDVGKQRDRNEDNFSICTQIATTETPKRGTLVTSRGLFILCDGMGGHASGEVASSMAIETIVEKFRPFWIDKLPGSRKLREIIHTANQSIYDLNETELRRDTGRMGTTLAIAAIYNSEIAIVHVGDSRIYQVTALGLQQITRDHEVANRLIDRGVAPEEAMTRSDAHQLTQALGPYGSDRIDPAIAYFQISEPTLFLLCSDGLCDNDLVETNWKTYLLPLLNPDADLAAGVKNLIDLGNRVNGHDNITAILVRCEVELSDTPN
jgi:protein phosphatase